ncbi:MAG: glycosyltransferase family 1 protein, partial [Planctomycetales bacterium]|nr:glycosyltransferase family 1 protein [Planctomycetales bacterium]
PLYTPLCTDEANQSRDELFFGGINVFLQQKIPLFRRLPRWIDRLLDHPGLVRKLASRRSKNFQAAQLGPLTLSMVRGEQGHQRKEVRRLVDWLAGQPTFDLIHLSNLLIAGCVPALKRRFQVPLVATLQGDDLFLESLPASYRIQVMQQLRELAGAIDRFIVPAQAYAQTM